MILLFLNIDHYQKRNKISDSIFLQAYIQVAQKNDGSRRSLADGAF
jgi:hypothetical protein